MAHAILTPLTQALADGAITRAELRDLMRRSDRPAALRLALWAAVVAATGALVALTWDSWLVWPAMFVHGVVLVHHFALQHECVHYTVFRTRWLNDVVGRLCGLITILPHSHFRYEHCDHHTHTQIHGQDPELVEMPRSWGAYALYLSALPYWRYKLGELIRHAAGRLTDEERGFIPAAARPTVYWEARAMLAVYAALGAAMVGLGWWEPLWFWLVPLALGEPVMRFIRMTEHVGRPTVAQRGENTRTNLVSAPWRFLAWNMNYHAEHHYAPSVPFHALPRLHEKLKARLHVEPGGYWGAHRDIARQLMADLRARRG